jgi:hypothetical protein
MEPLIAGDPPIIGSSLAGPGGVAAETAVGRWSAAGEGPDVRQLAAGESEGSA